MITDLAAQTRFSDRDPNSDTIYLWRSRPGGRWTGATLCDQRKLQRIAMVPQYFTDEQFDDVLRRVSEAGYDLCTPLDEDPPMDSVLEAKEFRFLDKEGQEIGRAVRKGNLYLGWINNRHFWAHATSDLLGAAHYQFHAVHAVEPVGQAQGAQTT